MAQSLCGFLGSVDDPLAPRPVIEVVENFLVAIKGVSEPAALVGLVVADFSGPLADMLVLGLFRRAFKLAEAASVAKDAKRVRQQVQAQDTTQAQVAASQATATATAQQQLALTGGSISSLAVAEVFAKVSMLDASISLLLTDIATAFLVRGVSSVFTSTTIQTCERRSHTFSFQTIGSKEYVFTSSAQFS